MNVEKNRVRTVKTLYMGSQSAARQIYKVSCVRRDSRVRDFFQESRGRMEEIIIGDIIEQNKELQEISLRISDPICVLERKKEEKD